MFIRPYKEEDQEFIINLAIRFTEFELMGWRQPENFKQAQLRFAKESLDRPAAGTEIFVAEDEDGERLGFLEMAPHVDK